jgi:hypothetical protein
MVSQPRPFKHGDFGHKIWLASVPFAANFGVRESPMEVGFNATATGNHGEQSQWGWL